jgi:ABC-2 type transport system ATP-binding protein
MIEAVELTKDYGTVVAVRNVTFRVGRGEVVGFLGLNGAGKTTTLRMLAGSLGPTSGRIRINGYDLEECPLEARRSLGYLPEAAPLYPEMRVSEYLMFRGRLKGLRGAQLRDAVSEAAERARVVPMLDTLIGHLSKGYRQRVGLAEALLGRPPLLILDEPTAGLDPNQIHEVRQLIRGLGADHTLLLSTHILSEVEATCDRALVIHRGRLVASGTLSELRALRAGVGAEFDVQDSEGRAAGILASLPRVAEVRRDPRADGGVTLEVDFTLAEEPSAGGDLAPCVAACVRALVTAGLDVSRATLRRPALDDVFRSLTEASP